MLKGLLTDHGLVFCLEPSQHLGCHASRMKYPMHLLKLKNLKTYFFTVEGVANAGDDVSFYWDKGEALGVVAESGCEKKSVRAQSSMRLFPSAREPRSALSLIPQAQD